MKTSRFQYKYRKTASKRHREVGELLRNSPVFNGYEIYQEYPVNKVNPNYHTGREHFDWVVRGLDLVIEVHGRQHEEPVCFGGKSMEEAIEEFNAQRRRDRTKADAAVAAGFTYIAIPDSVEITEEYIMLEFQKNFNPNSQETSKPALIDWSSKYQKAKERYKNSDRYQQDKDRAKLIRQERYKRFKEWKNK